MMSSFFQRLVERLGGLQVTVISALLHVILLLILGVTVFRHAEAEPPDFTSTEGGFVEAALVSQPEPREPATVSFPVEQTFSMEVPQPLASLAVITTPEARTEFAMAVSPVRGPSPGAMAEMEKAMLGAVRSVGTAGPGGGGGKKSGGGFGSLQADDSKLIGVMYDLTRLSQLEAKASRESR